MAPPKLYMIDLSPPVRTVLLTAKALGITLDCKVISTNTLGQTAPYLLQLDKRQTVPTLVDNGYIIWNSHSIMAFLIGKYGTDDTLYPRDVAKRAVIDEELRFESDLFSTIQLILRPMIKCGTKTVSKDKVANLRGAYDFLESFLEDRKWMAGDDLTIADLCLLPSVTSADVLVPIDPIRHSKIANWIKRCQALPYYYDANQVGLDNFKTFLKSL